MKMEINGLSKTYPNGVKALRDVSLSIEQGMFGLLGPNGAGKSTLMRTVATLQEADTGSIQLGDIDVLRDKDSVRRVLGYLPQEFGVYPRTSAGAMLNHLAMLKGVIHRGERKELVSAMLQRVNLYEHRYKYLSGFSGGMKQRFGIAQALLCNPQLLIVDEPTAGLDPNERNRFYNLLAEVGENTIVILSTHIVQDVKELCSNMAILCDGTIVFSGVPTNAVNELDGKIWERVVEKPELARFQKDFHVLSTKLVANKPLIHVFSESDPGDGFHSVAPELEDVYFSMTRKADEEKLATSSIEA